VWWRKQPIRQGQDGVEQVQSASQMVGIAFAFAPCILQSQGWNWAAHIAAALVVIGPGPKEAHSRVGTKSLQDCLSNGGLLLGGQAHGGDYDRARAKLMPYR